MRLVRVLVVGASGMLGHQAVRVLAPDFEVWGACRTPEALPDIGIPVERVIGRFDAMDPDDAHTLVRRVRPDVVVNAVGIVKQVAEAQVAVPSILVNSVWPHALADACDAAQARLIHVSTDCVFSGDRGMYTEEDLPDAVDLYGRSKLLGEVGGRDNAVTLRTSIIGWQLTGESGLLEWFAAHRNEQLHGYRQAIFSGVSTHALLLALRDFVLPDESLSGLWHVSAEPIDKHTLLASLADVIGWDVALTPVDEPVIDRSLDSERFRQRTGWRPPGWDEMLQQLAEEWRQRTI